MNTLKKLDKAYQARKRARRMLRQRHPRKDIEPLGPASRLENGRKIKPPQPTIIKGQTARAFKYPEDRGLASFADCKVVVQHTHYRDETGKLIRMKNVVNNAAC